MYIINTRRVLCTMAISGYSIILVYHFPINMCVCACACELYPFIVDVVFKSGFDAAGRKNILYQMILYACRCI